MKSIRRLLGYGNANLRGCAGALCAWGMAERNSQMDENLGMKKAYYGVIGLCGLLLGVTCMGCSALMNALLPFVRDTLKLTQTQSAFLTTVRQLFIVFSTLIMDKYFKALGVRWGAALAFCFASASGMLFGLSTSYPIAVFASALNGIGFGLGGAMAVAVLMNAWFDKGRGLMIGISVAGSALTGALLSVPIARVARAEGLYAAGRLWAVLFLCFTIFYVICVRNKPSDVGLVRYGEGEGKTKKSRRIQREPAAPMDSTGALLLVILGLCCGIPAFTLQGSFSLATTHMGYEKVTVAAAMALNGVLGIVGKSLYGICCEKIGAVKTAIIYFLGTSMACLTLVIFCNGTAVMPLYAAAMLIGFFLHPTSTVGYAMWSGDIANQEDYMKTLKKIQSMSVIAGLVFQTLPGIIADMVGSYKPMYFVHIASYVVAFLCILTLYRRYAGKIIRKDNA